MRLFIIAPFIFMGALVITCLLGQHVKISGQSVKQKGHEFWIHIHTKGKSRMWATHSSHARPSWKHKRAHQCLTASERLKNCVSLVMMLKSCWPFYWKHIVATACYFKTRDKKERLVFGRTPQICQHKWNLLSLSCAEKHQRTSKMRDCWWGGKRPGWGHAGGGKSANCTPEGWAGEGSHWWNRSRWPYNPPLKGRRSQYHPATL